MIQFNYLYSLSAAICLNKQFITCVEIYHLKMRCGMIAFVITSCYSILYGIKNCIFFRWHNFTNGKQIQYTIQNVLKWMFHLILNLMQWLLFYLWRFFFVSVQCKCKSAQHQRFWSLRTFDRYAYFFQSKRDKNNNKNWSRLNCGFIWLEWNCAFQQI